MLERIQSSLVATGFGFVAAIALLISSETAFRGVDKLASKVGQLASEVGNEETPILSTHLLNLKITSDVHLPASRDGRGGSLAAIGEDVIVMTHAGDFYVSQENKTVSLAIAPPDNGLDELVEELSNPQYDGLYMDLGQFRYLDVVTVQRESEDALYVSYTKFERSDLCYFTQISKLPFNSLTDSAKIAGSEYDWIEVFRTEPCLPLKDNGHVIAGHMAGAPMFYEPLTESILLSSGDYHWDKNLAPSPLLPKGATPIAQDEMYQYGKLIRIFLDQKTSTALSKGLRNTKGLLVDSAQQIWTLENGPRGGDELNLHTGNQDFGWPKVSLGTKYSGEPWNTQRVGGDHTGYDYPAFSWLPSIAPSEIIQIRNFAEEWDSDFLLGTMFSRALHRLRVRDGTVIYDETIRIGHRVRSLIQPSGDKLFVWTDSMRLLTIEPLKKDQNSILQKLEDFTKEKALDSQKAGQLQATVEQCQKCHGFLEGVENNGPNLQNVVGRSIGGDVEFEGYSGALKKMSGEVWSKEKLRRYLESPDTFAPGTYMLPMGVDTESHATLIEFIAYLGE